LLIVAGALLIVVGLIGGGSVGGAMWLTGRRPRAPRPLVVATPDPPLGNAPVSGGRLEMPDVVGLTEAEAREALLDVGLDPAAIKVAPRAYAGQPGRVVVQDPVRRTPAPTAATLSISAPTKVPKLRGTPVAAARATLQELGVQAVENRVYAADVPADQVVGTDPPADAPLAITKVTVQVSAPPASLFAAELRGVQSDCAKGDAAVNGTSHANSLVCSVSTGSPDVNDYSVGRHADRFEATIGISDSSEPTCVVRFTVTGDGTPLGSFDVPFGQSKAVGVVTSGRLRVALTAATLRPADRSCSAVWGEGRFVGSPKAIDELSANP